jgi:hypothetical protein
MKITRSQLMKILREAIQLSDENKEKAIAALKQRLEDEGGAMSSEDAKETAETASGVSMDDDDFEALTKTGDIESHKSGDVVDMSGLTEGGNTDIARRRLMQIIKEELGRLNEIDTSLTRKDAEYAYDTLAVRLRGDDDKVLNRAGTVKKLMTDPAGFEDMKQQIMQAMTHGHLKQNRAWDTTKSYWKEKLGLNEGIMVSLKPITSHPDAGKASTQKSRWAKLSGIPEEHINLNETIMDTTPMEDLMGTMAGEITDRFGNEMERLWDEDPAMMREQGYTDRLQWSRQVGSAELALEDELQQVMKQAVEEVETRLHDGQFYDERDSRSSMGGRDSNSDGKLDADELRDIADDLEG